MRLEGGLDLDATRHELVVALTRLGIADPQVVIEPVGHLVRLEGTRKLKGFVPLPQTS